MHLEMLSAICVNLDQSKILLSGNGLTKRIFMGPYLGVVLLGIMFHRDTWSPFLSGHSSYVFVLMWCLRLAPFQTSPGFYVSAVQVF